MTTREATATAAAREFARQYEAGQGRRMLNIAKFFGYEPDEYVYRFALEVLRLARALEDAVETLERIDPVLHAEEIADYRAALASTGSDGPLGDL